MKTRHKEDDLNLVKDDQHRVCVNLCSVCALLCAVQSLGLKPLGEDTGTADVLSRLIIESMM